MADLAAYKPITCDINSRRHEYYISVFRTYNIDSSKAKKLVVAIVRIAGEAAAKQITTLPTWGARDGAKRLRNS